MLLRVRIRGGLVLRLLLPPLRRRRGLGFEVFGLCFGRGCLGWVLLLRWRTCVLFPDDGAIWRCWMARICRGLRLLLRGRGRGILGLRVRRRVRGMRLVLLMRWWKLVPCLAFWVCVLGVHLWAGLWWIWVRQQWQSCWLSSPCLALVQLLQLILLGLLLLDLGWQLFETLLALQVPEWGLDQAIETLSTL